MRRGRGLAINPVMDQAQARADTANCLSSSTLYTVYFVHIFLLCGQQHTDDVLNPPKVVLSQVVAAAPSLCSYQVWRLV